MYETDQALVAQHPEWETPVPCVYTHHTIYMIRDPVVVVMCDFGTVLGVVTQKDVECQPSNKTFGDIMKPAVCIDAYATPDEVSATMNAYTYKAFPVVVQRLIGYPEQHMKPKPIAWTFNRYTTSN